MPEPSPDFVERLERMLSSGWQKAKVSLLAQFPVIGPHGSDVNQAELLLNGEKRLGWIPVVPESVDPFLPENQRLIAMEKKLDEAVREGRLKAADAVVKYVLPDGSTRESVTRHYAQPGLEQELQTVAAYNEKIWNRQQPDVNLEKSFGDYLGYRKRDQVLFGVLQKYRPYIPQNVVRGIYNFNEYVTQPAYLESILGHAVDKPMELKQAAQGGDPVKQWQLGNNYLYGINGFEKDPKAAAGWAQAAAERGFAIAQVETGRRYARGDVVPQNEAAAVKWFRLAADQGYPPGMMALAYHYESGRGVERDDAKALELFRKAAELGDGGAHFALGKRYAEGRGVPQDKAEAAFWYKLAARNNLDFPAATEALAQLTPDQRVAADKRVAEWKETHGSPKDIPVPAPKNEPLRPITMPRREPTPEEMLARAYAQFKQHIAMLPDNIRIAMDTPSALVTSSNMVKKWRINSAMETLEQTPEGKELVRIAEQTKLPLYVNPDPLNRGGGMWEEAAVAGDRLTGTPQKITLAGFSTEGDFTLILAHELRHLQQAHLGVINAFQGKLVSPEDHIFHKRVVEADAQATATEIAWQLKEQGKPEAWKAAKAGTVMPAEIADAYERVAASDPASLSDGRAKRAAFDEWFTAKFAKSGRTVADIYNYSNMNLYPQDSEKLLQLRANGAKVEPLTVDDFKKVGSVSALNYLDIPGGRPLDDPYYRRMDLNQETGRWLVSLKERFNKAARESGRAPPLGPLFHGTTERNLFEGIDLRKLGNDSQYGDGFYVTRNLDSAGGYALWGSKGGFVYSFNAVPGGGEWFEVDTKVDDALLQRVQQSMRALGRDPVSGRDFAAGADEIAALVREKGPMDITSFTWKLKDQYGVPGNSPPGAMTAFDIFHRAGISGISYPGEMVILDPQAVTKPKLYGYLSLDNPEASAVGALLRELNAANIPPEIDAELRNRIGEAVLDVEQKRPAAHEKMRAIRKAFVDSGIEMPPDFRRQLAEAEDVTRRMVEENRSQVQDDRTKTAASGNQDKRLPTPEEVAANRNLDILYRAMKDGDGSRAISMIRSGEIDPGAGYSRGLLYATLMDRKEVFSELMRHGADPREVFLNPDLDPRFGTAGDHPRLAEWAEEFRRGNAEARLGVRLSSQSNFPLPQEGTEVLRGSASPTVPAEPAFRMLANEDIAFLMDGDYTIRHVSTRAHMNEHLAGPLRGDAFPLTGMTQDVVDALAREGKVPPRGSMTSTEMMEKYGDVIQPKVQAAFEKLVQHNVDFDGTGGSTHMMLVQGMENSSADRDRYEFGKAGTQTIRPGQIRASVAVAPGDIATLEAGGTVESLLQEKLVNSIRGLRTGNASLVEDVRNDASGIKIANGLLKPNVADPASATAVQAWSIEALKATMNGIKIGDEARLNTLAQMAIEADPMATLRAINVLSKSGNPNTDLVLKAAAPWADKAFDGARNLPAGDRISVSHDLAGGLKPGSPIFERAQQEFAGAVREIAIQDPAAALTKVTFSTDYLAESDARLQGHLKVYAETFDALYRQNPAAAIEAAKNQAQHTKPESTFGKLLAERAKQTNPVLPVQEMDAGNAALARKTAAPNAPFESTQSLADFVRSSLRPGLGDVEVKTPPPSSHGFVAIVGDEVFKAPNSLLSRDAFEREALAQDLLKKKMATMGHLVPEVTASDLTGNSPYFGMERKQGVITTNELVSNLPPQQQEQLAKDIAQFMLDTRKALTPDEIKSLKLDTHNNPVTPETLSKSLADPRVQAALGPELLESARGIEKSYAAQSRLPSQELVLTHGDLNPYNLLFDQKSGRLNGVIDFGLVGLGTVEHEFMRLGDRPKPFLELVAKHYEAGGGGRVDVDRVQTLRAATLLNSLPELVADDSRQGYMRRVVGELYSFAGTKPVPDVAARAPQPNPDATTQGDPGTQVKTPEVSRIPTSETANVIADADAPVSTAQTGETRVTQTADRSAAPPAETAPVSKFMPEAKPTIMDGSAPANTTPVAGDTFNLGVGTTSAASVGFVFGAKGLYDSYKAGDNTGMGIAAANLATSSLEVTQGLMTAAGKTLPVITKAGKFIPGANFALTAVDGVYQISMEDTLAHKAERGAVVAAAAGSAVFVAPLAATGVSATLAATGLGAAIGTGAVATAAVAAAPVVITTAVVLGVVWAGGKVIEFKRDREKLDAEIAENAKPEKRQGVTSEDGKPTIRAFKHMPITMLRTSVDMKDENLNGKLVRNNQGQIPIGEILKLDMHDPKNIAEFERVLALHIRKQEDIMKANETSLPKWLDPREKVSKYTLAQMELADLTAARAELEMYRKELKDWDAAHPGDPATTRTAPRKTQPSSAAPNKPGV